MNFKEKFQSKVRTNPFKRGTMICTTLKYRWMFDFVVRILRFQFAPRIFFQDSIIFQKFFFCDLTLSNIPPTNTTSSFSTISTSSISIILSTNRRSTGLHLYIYSRLWPFQIRTAASGTEADSICLFRTSLSFRVQQNIVPLWIDIFAYLKSSYRL